MYITTLSSPVGFRSWLGQAPAPAVNWCQMGQTIAATARAEHARWTGPNGQQILENDPSRLPILSEYWAAVPVGNPGTAAAQSARDHDDFPWSAAFICFVMRRSGVLPAHGFRFGSKHITFIVGALRNREQAVGNFWLVDHIEVQREAPPAPGDLLCFNRCIRGSQQDDCGGERGRVRTTHTYSSLRRRFWDTNRTAAPTGSSHTAIVVGTGQDGRGQRFVETIGGNEEDSVRITRFPIDQHGGITCPCANHIFGMIKIVGC